MASPDMLNYFDSPNKSIDGQDDVLVIGGTSRINDVAFTAQELESILSNTVKQGVWDYSDLTTQSTPISIVADTPTLLTNDGAGANTELDYVLSGIDIYDTSTNEFTFDDIPLGSTVGIRIDLEVTTNSNNEQMNVFLDFGGGLFTLPWVADVQYKFSGAHRVVAFDKFYVGEAVRDNTAKVYVELDGSGSVKVNGWFIEVLSR